MGRFGAFWGNVFLSSPGGADNRRGREVHRRAEASAYEITSYGCGVRVLYGGSKRQINKNSSDGILTFGAELGSFQ